MAIDEAGYDQLAGRLDHLGASNLPEPRSAPGDAVTLDEDVAGERLSAMGRIHGENRRAADECPAGPLPGHGSRARRSVRSL